MKVYVVMRDWNNCGEYEEWDGGTYYLGLARSLEDAMAIVNKDVQTIMAEEKKHINNTYETRAHRFELTTENSKDDETITIATLLHGTVYKSILDDDDEYYEDDDSYESRYYCYEEEV